MTQINDTTPREPGYFQRLIPALFGKDVLTNEHLMNMAKHWHSNWLEVSGHRHNAVLELAAVKTELQQEKEKSMETRTDRHGNVFVDHTANPSTTMPQIPINLRKDVQITIIGLPKDFHEGEAAYISKILAAYATPIELPTMTEEELLNKIEQELIPKTQATINAPSKSKDY